MNLTLRKKDPVVEQFKKIFFCLCASACICVNAQLNSINVPISNKEFPLAYEPVQQSNFSNKVNYVPPGFYPSAACNKIKTVHDGVNSPVRNFQNKKFQYYKGAIIRGDSTIKEIALIFTGDEFADGGAHIRDVLQFQKIKASFFLTGNFYRNGLFATIIKTLNDDGHYLGPHSDRHLLYCDWKKRDSLLVTVDEFNEDLLKNLDEIKNLNINNKQQFFLPPYEWYNEQIARWTNESGLQLINFTPGTLSHADYTFPGTSNYRSSDKILQSILKYEQESVNGLNGFFLLLHIGTNEKRTDKFYYKLEILIKSLKQKGYTFKRVDELLQ